MTVDEFWDLITETRADDSDEHCRALAATVAKLPLEAIHVFGFRWHEALRAAYTWKLWGAAYLMERAPPTTDSSTSATVSIRTRARA